MKLSVLGSSSAGNCYLLQSEKTGEVLVLEAGVKPALVKRAISFNVSRIACCCITHEHGDHAKYAADYAEFGAPMIMSAGTAGALRLEGYNIYKLAPLSGGTFGGFAVKPFPVVHDAAEPFGYLIGHKECGTVLFATDTCYIKSRFDGLNNIMLECNYSKDMLDRNIESGAVSPSVRDRVMRSHMELSTCIDMLLANDLSKVNNIVLLHMSSQNSNSAQFVRAVAGKTGKCVHAARKGMEIEFNKTPF